MGISGIFPEKGVSTDHWRFTMTAVRFTTKVVRNTHTYLAQMPKNYVFNKLDLQVGDDVHQVRGFIGVRNWRANRWRVHSVGVQE